MVGLESDSDITEAFQIIRDIKGDDHHTIIANINKMNKLPNVPERIHLASNLSGKNKK
jgi:hypothetical protein